MTKKLRKKYHFYYDESGHDKKSQKMLYLGKSISIILLSQLWDGLMKVFQKSRANFPSLKLYTRIEGGKMEK